METQSCVHEIDGSPSSGMARLSQAGGDGSRGRHAAASPFKRVCASVLSGLLVFSLNPLTALADDASTSTTSTTSTTSSTVTADNTFTFTDSSVTASDTDGSGYEIDGTELTITAAGTYIVTGSCSSGNVTVAKGVTGVTLILQDLTLTSTTGAPVVCKKTSNVVIDVEGTVTLTDGEDPDDEDSTDEDVADAFEGACIKAKDGATLTITGSGTLNLDGSACKNGIKGGAETTLIIGESTSETFTINATTVNNSVASDGSVVVNGGTLNLTSTTGDGIKSEPEDDDTASAGTVTVNGGTITIDAYGDGIQSTGALVISDGTFDITTLDGASNASALTDDDSAKGIKSDTSVDIIGGTFTLDCAEDGVQTGGNLTITSGTFSIASGDDAIHADYVTTIGTSGSTSTTDPSIDVTTCVEGIEGATVNIYCGDIDIVSSDDAINAANSDLTDYSYELNIAGGSLYLVATGDGIDSNGTISFTGGTVEVYAPASGDNTAIDCGDSSTWSVTDTTLLALGGSGMTPVMPSAGVYVNFGSGTSSTQPGFGGRPGQGGSSMGTSLNIAAGATVAVKDSSGTTLYEATAGQAATTALFASPDLVSGETYTLYVNGTAVATATAAGTATSGSSSSDTTTTVTSIASATVSDIADQTYTGEAIEPDVTVTLDGTTLTEDTDYEVYYYSNIGVGTATVLVLGIGDYTGTVRTTFNIVAADDSDDDSSDDIDISGATISDIEDQTYTGDAIEPDVTVTLDGTTLTAGTDYYVEYSDNVEVGTATVTVTGTGDYTGTATATFEIVAEGERYTITKNYVGGDYGTVTIIDGADGTTATMYPYAGDTVTFRTSPDVGYTLTRMSYTYTDPDTGESVTKALTRISGTGRAGTNSVYSFTMPAADVTINATFGENHRTITKDITGSGLLMVVDNGDGVAASLYPQVGTTVRFKAIASSGYELTNLYYTVEGTTKHLALTKVDGTTNVYEFTMPNWNVTLHGVFVEE